MDRRINELLISVSVRVVTGTVSGGTFALAGWFIAWFFFLRPSASLTESMIVFMAITSVAGGLGASLAWLRPDDGLRANLPMILLAVLGGVGGVLAGLAFARTVFDVDVTRGEGDVTAIAAAGIAANLPPLIMFLVGGLRWPTGRIRQPLRLPSRSRTVKPL